MNQTLAALRDDMCRVGASLFARGYVHASAGNISVRVPTHMGGGYLITPTDACLGFLKPNELSWLDDGGLQLSRAGVPAGALSIPSRYIHTPVQMVDYDDVQNTVRLLVNALSGPVDVS